MEFTEIIASESFKIFVFLAPGYLGLRIYLIDKPWNELDAIHIFYGSLVFSVLSYGTYFFLVQEVPVLKEFLLNAPWVFAVGATLFALLYALIWRCLGHPFLHQILKFINVTTEDNTFTPWTVIFNNTSINLTQITVHLKDGRSLQLDEAGKYYIPALNKAAVYPYYTSKDGDITMVVTQTRESESAEWTAVPDIYVAAPWGLKLSYIPREEISRVDVRVIPRKQPSSSVRAVQFSSSLLV